MANSLKAKYNKSVDDFLKQASNEIVGQLVHAVADTGVTTLHSKQFTVWQRQIEILKNTFESLASEPAIDISGWHIALEYEIPRRQKRPDVILLTEWCIVVVEFKFGISSYESSAIWQVEEYCFNLRDFHLKSQKRPIVPVLCAADAPQNYNAAPSFDDDSVSSVLLTNKANLWKTLKEVSDSVDTATKVKNQIDPISWINSPYRPTLNIIEAAEQLFNNHSVREISHNYAENLNVTTDTISKVVQEAKNNSDRVVCFVTGVPGAGKTLTGPNVVHDPKIRAQQGPSGILLSGNGPLVKIVKEALVLNQKKTGRAVKEARYEVSTFIQNVHQFLRYHRENPNATPHEHMVVFDEAQRAWNREQMYKKQGVDRAESAVLLEVMERTEGWAVIVALVGGGQEIHLGEAGLEEWGLAVENASEHWTIVASPEVIGGGSSVAGHRLFKSGIPKSIQVREEPSVHLSVNVRSHRAQEITKWVNYLLDLNTEKACQSVPHSRHFPLYLTRSLETARTWLLAKCNVDSNKRCGLVTTSEDQRLRAYGIETSTGFRQGFMYEKWFLAPPEDVRSSYFLEVAASEFECQGLELDWVGVCWGGDLTTDENYSEWEYRRFRGTNWQYCQSETEQAYIRNRYRVLLTRARSGMVIWIPPGSSSDMTLDSCRFDRIYQLLKRAGLSDLDESEL